MENWRSRNVLVLLYEENEVHKNALELIRFGKYDYALIRHDMDVWTEGAITQELDKDPSFSNSIGDPKKPHYHVVLKFGNARYRDGIATELGIEPRFLEKCGNLEMALAYLIHWNDEDKYPYSIDDVEGSLRNTLQKVIRKGEDEGVKVCEFLDWLDDTGCVVSFNLCIRAATAMGLYSEIRRGGSLIARAILEHNERYRAKAESEK